MANYTIKAEIIVNSARNKAAAHQAISNMIEDYNDMDNSETSIIINIQETSLRRD